MPEPLHIVRWRPGEPHPVLVTVQLAIAVAILILGSQLFVIALNQTASALHVGELVLALVIVPIATELPETLNSVLWVRSNDDMLAFGNVAGSATFQSCVLATIGVMFTTWSLSSGGVISAVLTIATAAYLLVPALAWYGARRAPHAHARCRGSSTSPRRSSRGGVSRSERCTIWRSWTSTAPESVEAYATAVTAVPRGGSVRAQRAAHGHRQRARGARFVQRAAEASGGSTTMRGMSSARQAGRRRIRCWCPRCRRRGARRRRFDDRACSVARHQTARGQRPRALGARSRRGMDRRQRATPSSARGPSCSTSSDHLVDVPVPPGSARLATLDDVPLLAEWLVAFGAEVDLIIGLDPRATAERSVRAGSVRCLGGGWNAGVRRRSPRRRSRASRRTGVHAAGASQPRVRPAAHLRGHGIRAGAAGCRPGHALHR